MISSYHHPPSANPRKKIIKTTSKSLKQNVKTKSLSLKQLNRIHLQPSVLPNQLNHQHQHQLILPNLLFTYRLFQNKNKNVEAYQQKIFQSKVYISRAEFQGRKIQQQRQKIAKKNIKSKKEKKHVFSGQIIDRKATLDNQIQERHERQIQQSFFTPLGNIQELVSQKVISRIKTAVSASRKRMKDLYTMHNIQQQLKSAAKDKKRVYRQYDQRLNTASDISSLINPHQTYQHINSSSSSKIKASNSQQKLIKDTNQGLQIQNRSKEKIVLNQLKKIFYGYRKGKFIQENVFKTRLDGENSEAYMRVLRQQEEILQKFDGSTNNRKHMIQKFGEILGKIRSKTQAK